MHFLAGWWEQSWLAGFAFIGLKMDSLKNSLNKFPKCSKSREQRQGARAQILPRTEIDEAANNVLSTNNQEIWCLWVWSASFKVCPQISVKL